MNFRKSVIYELAEASDLPAERQKEVDLVYQTLGAIPHPEFGTINLFPFCVESDETNALKRKASEGIVTSLDSAGLLSSGEAHTPTRSIRVLCRSCGTILFSGTTDLDGGGLTVAAPALLTALAGRRAECPHDAYTPDDLRRHIEESAQ